MSTPNSIIQSFFQVVEENPNKIAIIWKDESLSYRQLAQWVEAYAHFFTAKGLKRGDRILFHGQTSLRFPAIYLACHRIGAVAVPVDARMAPGKRNELFIQIEPAIALFPGSLETSFAFEELDQDIDTHQPGVINPFLKAMRLQIYYLLQVRRVLEKGYSLPMKISLPGLPTQTSLSGIAITIKK